MLFHSSCCCNFVVVFKPFGAKILHQKAYKGTTTKILMKSYPINSKKIEEQKGKKKDPNSYSFIFRQKDYGFGNYKEDKYAIQNKVGKQLDETSQLSKISYFKFDTGPFLEDTKITVVFKKMDKKTAQKIAKMNGWTLLE
jgi:hypothetical protein